MTNISYNIPLVVTSLVIASLASYTAFDLTGRVTLASGWRRLVWLAGGSIAMGLGIWSMHFVGMLAFHMTVPMRYNIQIVVVSALIAIAASGLALITASRVALPPRRLVAAGALMGLAIAGTHYTGMAAMRMPATVTYDPLLLVVSIAIAVGASIAALRIAFHFRYDDTRLGWWRKTESALLMGMAIAGMHYTGMSAARFTRCPGKPSLEAGTLANGMPLAVAVVMGTLLVLLLALVGASIDRRARRADAENARLRCMRDEMEQQVISRTRELQAALVAAECASHAKSEFLTHMSHELRTPLNSIIGFTNVLRKNKAVNLRVQDLNYLERIGANGQHLLSVINNILDLAKVEAGHIDTIITTVSVGSLIHDVIMQLEGTLRSGAVQLHTDIPDQLAPIHTDEGKLRQILINLIANAIKFTEAGSITVRVVTNPGNPTPQRIEVSDTGIGIPADRLNAVFQPFEQADTSVSRKYGGTGLGLTITQSLCDLLGAQLSVSSIAGCGSTFSIQLPVAEIPTDHPLESPSNLVVKHPPGCAPVNPTASRLEGRHVPINMMTCALNNDAN